MQVASVVLLIAEGLPRLDEIAREADRSRTSGILIDATTLSVITIGLAVGALVVWIYARWYVPHSEHPPASPQGLLEEICRAHRLKAAQKRLIEWVAAEHQLVQPVMVFLDPRLLDMTLARCKQPEVRKRLSELRSRLFEGLTGGL
jgi:hypothetical protein